MIQDFLRNLNISPNVYLKRMKQNAREYGLDSDRLFFSDKQKYKLYYVNQEGKRIYFGANNYKDYFIYELLEKKGYYPEDYAFDRRLNYLSRSRKIKGNWKDDKLSKNNLAINILW